MATHQLVLKVMRTSRPGFDFQFPTVFDQKNLPGTEALTASSLLDIPSLPAKDRLNELGISQLLILSANFGNIYLGESFSAYLSVNNDSQIPVQDVSFKAELQTTSQRFVLANSSSLQSSPRESLTGSQMSLAPDSHQGILPGTLI